MAALAFGQQPQKCGGFPVQQRCWLHKVRNILDKLPQRERDEAAKSLRAIYLSQTREEAKTKALSLARSWKGLEDRGGGMLGGRLGQNVHVL